jgi:mannose-6-phosphate isomerase-like protein (cupin superfamily)
MGQGYVVSEHDVKGRLDEGDTALTKITIDSRHGCERLEQRVIRFRPGRSQPRRAADREELLFVAAGRGALELERSSHALEPDTGAYVPAGDVYVIDNPGPEELLVVSVSAPAPADTGQDGRRVTVRYADQPVLRAGADREFRYLVNQDAGCREATQFVGVIPPSRAPLHSHTYDEVIYLIEGEGVLHVGDEQVPIAAGSCIHLPPHLVHCLENNGSESMRVLGVFHPSGDPASRAYDEEPTNT